MYTILIIEDDTNIQEKIKNIFSNQNMLVITSEKGRDALKIALEREIDVFIIDIKLPDWNGIDLSKELRKTYPYIPFIIASSVKSPYVRLQAYEQIGNVIYLTKPFTEKELLQKV